MKMILRQLGRFKKDALLCIGMTTLEVAMDILLPLSRPSSLTAVWSRPICQPFTVMAL